MWKEYDPATDSVLCLKPNQAKDYPLGTRAHFNGVEFVVVKQQPIRDATSQEVHGFFVFFKPVAPQDLNSDS